MEVGQRGFDAPVVQFRDARHQLARRHAGAFVFDQRRQHAGKRRTHAGLVQQLFLARDLLAQHRLLQAGSGDAAGRGAARVVQQCALLAQLDLGAPDIQLRAQEVFAGDQAAGAQLLVAFLFRARGLQIDFQQFDGAGDLPALLLHVLAQHGDAVVLLRQLLPERVQRQPDLAVVQFQQ
jgi:hypothetical protein